MRTGWLGVGNMGLPMVERLLGGGHEITLYDIRAEALQALAARGCPLAASPRDLADRCELVFLSLPSLAATRAAVLGSGLLEGKALKLLVDTSTVGPAIIGEVAEAARPRGIRVVDCPISGGVQAAQAGTLSVMVAGAAEDIDALRPLLSLWGKSVVVAGEKPGAAQALKLVNNLIILSAYVGTLEAFVFGAKAGLTTETMLAAINAGTLAPNGTTKVWLPQFILKGMGIGARLDMMGKDLDLALAEAQQLGVPMAVCEAARQVAARAEDSGLGEEDVMSLVKVIEAESGFHLPRAAAPER